MTNKLQADLNSQNAETREQALQYAIRAAMDLQLKNELKAEIPKPHRKQRTKVVSFLQRWRIAASIVLICGFGIWLWNMSDSTYSNQCYASEIFAHPGLSKGSNDASLFEAIEAYKNQDWQLAASLFASIEPQTTENLFFEALSYFNKKDYATAASKLLPVIEGQELYAQEAKWFIGLSYLYNDQVDKAISSFSEILPSQWKYKEAQEILKEIK